MDWNCDAKGHELFPIDSPLREKLAKNNRDIQSWDRTLYRPKFLSFKGVHSWKDFIHFLGFNLPEIDEPEYLVFYNLGLQLREYNFAKGPKEKMVLFMWEPPVVQPELYDPKIQKNFGKIFTWDDDLVDNVKFFKFHYPVLKERIAELVPFEEKKFCTLINGRLCSKHPKELYSERERVIRFYEDKIGEFDLYGRFWAKRKYRNDRGPIDDKIAVLKNYKFCICYENMRDVRGYVTEKIFDCFSAGAVPVYLGASNITDYVPKECFVDRREFESDEQVYDFLKGMSQETYEAHLLAAKRFLESDQAQVFSENQFLEIFLSHMIVSN